MYLDLTRFLPGRARFSTSRRVTDEHLLGGADEASVQALGASAPVLSIFSRTWRRCAPTWCTRRSAVWVVATDVSPAGALLFRRVARTIP